MNTKMNTKRDKFLTEQMGECWHKWTSEKFIPHEEFNAYESVCTKCGYKHSYLDIDYITSQEYPKNNFSTWEGFGKLWEWCQKQGWWCKILYSCNLDISLMTPDRFANVVYAYLKEKL